MPNHVQNIITFNCSADRLKEILQSIQAEDEENFESVGIGTIDFQKIIPMPDSLHIESGSQTTEGINLYLTSINPSVNYYGDKPVRLEMRKKDSREKYTVEVQPEDLPDELDFLTQYYTGVSLTPQLQIVGVMLGFPAEKSGIMPGDIIKKFNICHKLFTIFCKPFKYSANSRHILYIETVFRMVNS